MQRITDNLKKKKKKSSSAHDHILKTHVAHRTCKPACFQLSVDIKAMVIKICNHFSVSTSRGKELRTRFVSVDIEWREILRYAHDGSLVIQRSIVSKSWSVHVPLDDQSS